MLYSTEDVLMHYGVKRRSGRYPYGSGDNPFQHEDFLKTIRDKASKGMNEKDIAESLGMSTTEYRIAKQYASHKEREQLRLKNQNLIDEGVTNRTERARILGMNESSLRSLENETTASNKNAAFVTADILRKELESKKMIDVGAGVERELGVSRNKLDEALYMLELEGKNVYGVGVQQLTNPTQKTTLMVLTNEDITYGQAYNNVGDIQSLQNYTSDDDGATFRTAQYPSSISSDRIFVKYGEEGAKKEGVIELRRGVNDISLGEAHYAQVRIMVDDSHYLKGMAMYSDDIPEGYDVVFNTMKSENLGKKGVMKPIKDDPDNPFGAYIPAKGQTLYFDKDGNQKLGAVNKLKEEGDWDTMAKNLSQQFLSKQPLQLINKQLNLTYADYESQFDEIMSLENPTLKKKMLIDFANECDSAAIHMKAAALPRQKMQVILPIEDLKDNEIYAPNYRNGEKVALVRFPHEGTFAIPILTVNNKNESARKILGTDITDAVGINTKVAERLSGADFDGDTVVVIPTHNSTGVKISSTPPLKDLEGWDNKSAYPERPGMTYMTKSGTQKQMGMISNLITDMTLQGATGPELARATKHSMVVIDAEKHKLDYKKSEKDNGIAELREKYQRRIDLETGEVKIGGASTLLSRRKQEVQVPERRGSGIIDPETGKIFYKETGRTYIDPKTGNIKEAKTKVPLMSTVDDANILSSGTLQEKAYASYANKMKALANASRKEYKATKEIERDPVVAERYSEEVKSLMNSLDIASRNQPKERRAQAIANGAVKEKIKQNPDILKNKKDINKVKQNELQKARNSVGASSKDVRIDISDREWEAIQSGAISATKQREIFRYADQDALKQRALPKTTNELSLAKQNKIASMRASGYTNAQIADELGVSTSTVTKYAA